MILKDPPGTFYFLEWRGRWFGSEEWGISTKQSPAGSILSFSLRPAWHLYFSAHGFRIGFVTLAQASTAISKSCRQRSQDQLNQGMAPWCHPCHLGTLLWECSRDDVASAAQGGVCARACVSDGNIGYKCPCAHGGVPVCMLTSLYIFMSCFAQLL